MVFKFIVDISASSSGDKFSQQQSIFGESVDLSKIWKLVEVNDWDVNEKLEKVMIKSLEKNMENRYRTAGSFLKALESTCNTEKSPPGYWQEQNLI